MTKHSGKCQPSIKKKKLKKSIKSWVTSTSLACQKFSSYDPNELLLFGAMLNPRSCHGLCLVRKLLTSPMEQPHAKSTVFRKLSLKNLKSKMVDRCPLN